MNEVLPPMVKCSECVYAFKYYDNILGKSRYACSTMQEIGEFDDFYAIVDSGCVYGIKSLLKLPFQKATEKSNEE